MDQFIGDSKFIGKGYGSAFIAAFIDYFKTYIDSSVHTFIVDPEPINYAAIRCYEKVGFKKVGEFENSYGHIMLMRFDV